MNADNIYITKCLHEYTMFAAVSTVTTKAYILGMLFLLASLDLWKQKSICTVNRLVEQTTN